MTRDVAPRFVAFLLAAVGLVACGSDPAPTPGAEPTDTDTAVVRPMRTREAQQSVPRDQIVTTLQQRIRGTT